MISMPLGIIRHGFPPIHLADQIQFNLLRNQMNGGLATSSPTSLHGIAEPIKVLKILFIITINELANLLFHTQSSI